MTPLAAVLASPLAVGGVPRGALVPAVPVVLALLAAAVVVRRERHLRAVQAELARTADQFGRIFRDSPVGMGMSDAEGHLVAVNPAFCRLVGRPAEQLLGASDLAYTHEDDRNGHAATGPRIAAATDRVAQVEKRYVRPDGAVRWVWLTLTHVEPPAGAPGPWTLAHVQDVTERHQAEQALRDSERTLSTVTRVARRVRRGDDARATIVQAVHELAAADAVALVEPAPDGAALVVTAAHGGDLAGTRIPLGTSVTTDVWRLGRPVFLADTSADARVSPVLLALTGARSVMWQPVVGADGTTALLAVVWKVPVPSAADPRPQAVGALAHETALALDHERLIRQLQELAETDQLTGLPNRRGWDARLAGLAAQATREGGSLTVAIADLDRFKRFNDRYGHPAGDALLRETAAAFLAVLREGDLVARWGGEEFAVALPGLDATDAASLLERLRCAVPAGQTCSIGYAVWDGVRSLDALLEQADVALYDAKQRGRDRVREAQAAGRAVPALPLTAGRG